MRNHKKISRESFLKSALFSAFLLTATPSYLLGKTHSISRKKKRPSKNGFSFAFFTDIHISPHLDNLRDEELPAPRETLTDVPFLGFERALEEVKKQNVDFVLTGGDNLNTESYYLPSFNGRRPVSIPPESMALSVKKMNEITSTIGLPIYYANGNHDVYYYPPAKQEDEHYGSVFFADHLGYQRQSYYSFDVNGWHFIVINTHDGNGNKLGFSREQLQWLKNDLRKTGKDTPVILTGHVPFPLHQKYDELSFKIYDVLKNYHVKLGLFGHWHAYHEFMWHDIPCVIGSSLSGAVWSLVRNVHDIDLGGINKGTDQGYLIVSLTDRDIRWKHYPFSYSIEKFYYEKTGRRSSVSYPKSM